MNAAAAARVASRIGRPNNTDRDENWMVQATRSSRGSQRALVDAQFVRELIERQQHAVARQINNRMSCALQDRGRN